MNCFKLRAAKRRAELRLLAMTLGWGTGLLAAAAQAQPMPDRYPLTGKIKDQLGTPLNKVTVTIRRQDSTGPYAFWGAFAATDAQGVFRVPEAEEGRYYLNAELPGFGQIQNRTLDWKVGDKPLDIILQRLASFRAVLRQESGGTLNGAPFYLRMRGDSEAGVVSKRLNSGTEGSAVVAGIVPANYSLYFSVPGQGYGFLHDINVKYDEKIPPVDVYVRQGGGLKFSVRDIAEGAPADIPRAVGGASILLNPQAGIQAFEPSKDLRDPGENVALLGASGWRSRTVSEDGSGEILLQDMPPGKYNARIYLGAQAPFQKEVEIVAGKTSEHEITFPRRPGSSVVFTVNGKSGKPVPNRNIVMRMTALDGQAQQVAAPVPGGGGPGERRARTDENGKFTLYPLRPGRYRMWFNAPPRDGDFGPSTSMEVTVKAEPTEVTLGFTALP